MASQEISRQVSRPVSRVSGWMEISRMLVRTISDQTLSSILNMKRVYSIASNTPGSPPSRAIHPPSIRYNRLISRLEYPHVAMVPACLIRLARFRWKRSAVRMMLATRRKKLNPINN